MKNDPITRAEAMRHAEFLDEQGFYGIEIVESFPDGNVFIRALNRASQKRVFATKGDLAEIRGNR